jgi:hypothetical protein
VKLTQRSQQQPATSMSLLKGFVIQSIIGINWPVGFEKPKKWIGGKGALSSFSFLFVKSSDLNHYF